MAVKIAGTFKSAIFNQMVFNMLNDNKLTSFLSGLKENSFNDMVLGNPVTVKEITLLPVLSVSSAFGGSVTQQGTCGGGIRLDPVAVVVVRKDTANVYSLYSKASFKSLESLAALIPEILSTGVPCKNKN